MMNSIYYYRFKVLSIKLEEKQFILSEELMSEVLVITSGKGGVGKTTTCANIGTGLAKMGYKEGYYNKFMPIIKQLISAGVIIRTPRDSDKNYVNGTKNHAYMLFNFYTEEYIDRYRCTSNVSFLELLQICKWAKHVG